MMIMTAMAPDNTPPLLLRILAVTPILLRTVDEPHRRHAGDESHGSGVALLVHQLVNPVMGALLVLQISDAHATCEGPAILREHPIMNVFAVEHRFGQTLGVEIGCVEIAPLLPIRNLESVRHGDLFSLDTHHIPMFMLVLGESGAAAVPIQAGVIARRALHPAAARVLRGSVVFDLEVEPELVAPMLTILRRLDHVQGQFPADAHLSDGRRMRAEIGVRLDGGVLDLLRLRQPPARRTTRPHGAFQILQE
mmetsp:Transcript_55452/g.168545  ORF Transcript_55452/g.168545 Transcript_55452/m.168545 type:complete len:251 (+) Transcript_55452:2427-3179(+)